MTIEHGLRVGPVVVAGRIGADMAVVRDAVETVRDVVGEYDGSPSTLAACVLWQRGDWTQQEVCDAAGCTPAGLRQARERI